MGRLRRLACARQVQYDMRRAHYTPIGIVVLTALSVDCILLFVGDSTVRALGGKEPVAPPSEVFGNEMIKFFGIAGVNRVAVCNQRGAPSACTATKILRQAMLSEADRARVRAVLLNFAGQHLLHIFPHRPWWWDDPRISTTDNYALRAKVLNSTYAAAAQCAGSSESADHQHACNSANYQGWPHFADYGGFINLERWIQDDVTAYRKALPNAQIVLATANWVCEGKKYGYHKWLTGTAEGIATSTASCQSFLKAHSSWPQPADLYSACRRSQQTSDGTVALSRRIRVMAKKLNASLTDWNNLTMGQCSHTKDGHHYDRSIVRAQLHDLRILIGSDATSTTKSLPQAPAPETKEPSAREHSPSWSKPISKPIHTKRVPQAHAPETEELSAREHSPSSKPIHTKKVPQAHAPDTKEHSARGAPPVLKADPHQKAATRTSS